LSNNVASTGLNWLTGSKFMTNSYLKSGLKRQTIFKNSVLGSKHNAKNITISNKRDN